MTAAVFIQVVLRYLGLTGIDGIEEIPRFLFVWLVMIGGAAAMWRHEHTVLDYFLNRCGPICAAFVSILINGLGIFFFAYMIWLLHRPGAQCDSDQRRPRPDARLRLHGGACRLGPDDRADAAQHLFHREGEWLKSS